MARPIGSQRPFISIPAAIAASAPPPAVSTVSAANCAAPEKTMSDITTGAIEPMTGCASTPNEIPPRERGQHQRQSGAHPGSDVARLVHCACTLPYTGISSGNS